MNGWAKVAIGGLLLLAGAFGMCTAIGVLFGVVAQLVALPFCFLAGLGYGDWAIHRWVDPS
jgi:hypothetical protein